ncbi:unnamed protein product [Parnassius mnemosyne]|uniref:Uncharacterized protein n=1 Tax=Parnassius mnemosyne TaxID=213953 RepID=A0AAV1M1S9_9NEOP
MIFIMILFILTELANASKTHVGSAIFYNKQGNNECWSDDELAKLRARKIFEQLMPSSVYPEKINSRYIREMLSYFRYALRNVVKDADPHAASLLKTALADTMGAHLTKEILPTARFSYYAGYVPYRSVRELHDFLEHIKLLLNTQGLGWARPDRVPRWSNLTVVKVFAGYGKLVNPCSCLVTKRDTNSCIHLPKPKLDDEFEPSAIALPFKFGGFVSLTSPGSENILLRYYTTATRCILRKSPEPCRHIDFLNFNNELWHWMKRDVAPHLMDEKLYSAYGGILRVAAAVQSYGKGLSRRNLFENEDQGVLKWHPWKTLTDTYIYMDPEWSPKLYVVLVLLAAIFICLLQTCYTYIIGKTNACHCTGRNSNITNSKENDYRKVESVIPLAHLHQSSVYYSDHKRLKCTPSRTKTSSLGSTKTQRVYDFHENTEKMMAVIMSDNEETSDVESLSPSKREESEEILGNIILDVGETVRAKSPPKIETSISQVKIDKTPNANRLQMYSASTVTHSEMTYCHEEQDTGSGWSVTSTSEQSISSDSSKSRCRKVRSSRDLAWARRVASKASQAKSKSKTEFDGNSFATPPSPH